VNDRERIRAFGRELDDRLAERRVETPVGDGLFVDALPDVYFLNYLRGDRGTGSELAAEAERVMETFHHRKVFTYLDVDLGWDRTAHLVMARHREPDRRVETAHVRELPFEAIAPLRLDENTDRRLGERLNEGQRRIAKAIDTHWVAAFEGDRIASWCQVRSRGGIAQIEDVNTIRQLRRRGHGRAVVQHAVDEARATHELVYLEALEEDWPRELYAKLGFETIDRCYHHVVPGHPLTRLHIRTPRLELRLATIAEQRELFHVAEAGIHDPAVMPFEIPWTDDLDEDGFLAYHRDNLATWSTNAWHLNLVAFLDGRPVGTQGLNTGGDGRVVTGSWLGRAYQGQGLGSEMRSAILSFAFETLGAEVARSGAFVDNPQSLGVSRKLGYEVTGSHVVTPRGEPVEHTDLELRRERFRPLTEVEITGADASWFGLT
jgi:RimJ/RimL family protein N-acetyltransferase/ribosomal protein S18 acetylase RimI-like enzyme